MQSKEHWERVYTTKATDAVSWFQESATQSMDFINKSKSPIVINSIVLCELIWVLESCYDYSKEEIIHGLSHVLKVKQFFIPEKEIIRQSLNLYQKTKIDFSDVLIAYKNKLENCNYTITFDKQAAKIDLYKLLK
jgi:predicted nucleic-acid-binding protein